MKKCRWLSPVVAGILLASAAPATATPITWAFTGTIDGNPYDQLHHLDGSVVDGTPFSGTYTFESTMTDDLPDDHTVGLYTQPVPPTSVMVLNVGNYTIIGWSDKIQVENRSKDWLALTSQTFISDPIGLESITISCEDIHGQVFVSDTLPLVPPPLEAFNGWSYLSVTGVWSGDPLLGSLGFGGPLSSLTPEPLSFLLIVGGVVAFTFRRPTRRFHS